MIKQSYQLAFATACVALLALLIVASGEKFKSPCGTEAQVARRLGECMQPIFYLLEGKINEPRGDEDLIGHCNMFNNSERCIRNLAKECLTGLHKTAVGAVASSSKRFRVQQCKDATSRSRYIEPMKCSIMKGKEMAQMMRNLTGIAQAVFRLPIPPEQRLIRGCCVLNLLDKEIETRYNRDCPQATPQVQAIARALSDDARSTLCVNPKCKGVLDSVMRSPYKPPQNFIEPIMQIVFALNAD